MSQTILIVDNDPGICDNLATYLEDEGLRVYTAQCGDEIVTTTLQLAGLNQLPIFRKPLASMESIAQLLRTDFRKV